MEAISFTFVILNVKENSFETKSFRCFNIKLPPFQFLVFLLWSFEKLALIENQNISIIHWKQRNFFMHALQIKSLGKCTWKFHFYKTKQNKTKTFSSKIRFQLSRKITFLEKKNTYLQKITKTFVSESSFSIKCYNMSQQSPKKNSMKIYDLKLFLIK